MPREAKLNFYFTEEDFYPDVKNSDDCDLLHEYEKDRFHTLYKRGFGPKPRKSASEDYRAIDRISTSHIYKTPVIRGF